MTMKIFTQEDTLDTITPHERELLIAHLQASFEDSTDVDHQILHEMSGVDEGVERFRATLTEKSTKLADTAAGERYLTRRWHY